MLLGEYAHTIDDKGRFTMPTKLRDALKDGFVITRGLDGCLYMYDAEHWRQFEEKLVSLPMTNRPAREFIHFFVSGAVESNYDKQGRVPLPVNLREYAKLGKDIVIVGAGNHAEIWDADAWRKDQDSVVANIDALADQMSGFQI